MPIEILDCDGNMGNIIESRGLVTDQELVDSFKRHLTQDREKFKTYKYVLLDHTALTKMEITNETVELIAGLWADTSRANPDPVADNPNSQPATRTPHHNLQPATRNS